jgi:alkanesulfonate monooxygenase SsuD/methylene tetrahydromethanopterin reductase-like flavin-dependent oxidoreductase (luciferase family)
MEFGLLYEVQGTPELGGDDNRLYRETLEQCELADRLGYHSVWFVEHHFLTGFSSCPAPDLLMAALSQRTKRMRLGFGVSVLPHHHPIRVAERVAMLDQISDGRVEFGTGRGSAYEQVGTGVKDPRDSRDMWEESLRMIAAAWQSKDTFSWEGRFWNQVARHIVPKPYQKPHPALWMACLSLDSYAVAAEHGLGVLSSTSFTPQLLEGYIKQYRKDIEKARPIGAQAYNRWGNHVVALCGEDDGPTKELCVESLKAFFGPDKPYVQGRSEIYEQLIKAWGGVPKHLEREFGRWLKRPDEKQTVAAKEAVADAKAAPGSAQRVFAEMDSKTLCERGVIMAGNPESCVEAARKYEAAGVDLLIMMMQTESVPHEKIMKSIELVGREVMPRFKGARAGR